MFRGIETGLLTVTRKPVPRKRSNKDVEKVTVARNRPPVGLGWIRLAVIMERIKERSIDQCPRPEHGSWLHEIFSHHACHPETNALRSESKHDIEAPAKILSIESSLSHDRISEVANAIPECRVGHDHN